MLIKYISRVAGLTVESLKIGFRLNANSKPPRMRPRFKTMIYPVISSQEEKFVRLNCTGDMTLAEMTTAWRKVQLALAELGWERIARMRMAVIEPVSLDAETDGEGSRSYAEVIADERAKTPCQKLENETNRAPDLRSRRQ